MTNGNPRTRTEKPCPKCKQILPLVAFSRNTCKIDGRQNYCAKCMVVMRRTTMRASWLNGQYNITPDDYSDMILTQGGRCAVCGDALQPGRESHIDHCHKTNRVRGVLCRGCNLGLGNFKDRPQALRFAADYLEKGGI
jgi:hypothetical protein